MRSSIASASAIRTVRWQPDRSVSPPIGSQRDVRSTSSPDRSRRSRTADTVRELAERGLRRRHAERPVRVLRIPAATDPHSRADKALRLQLGVDRVTRRHAPQDCAAQPAQPETIRSGRRQQQLGAAEHVIVDDGPNGERDHRTAGRHQVDRVAGLGTSEFGGEPTHHDVGCRERGGHVEADDRTDHLGGQHGGGHGERVAGRSLLDDRRPAPYALHADAGGTGDRAATRRRPGQLRWLGWQRRPEAIPRCRP